MGKLEDLYKVRDMLHANGMELSEEQKKALDEAEEAFVRTEMAAALKQSAAAALKNVQRPLRIIIDHQPGEEPKIEVVRYEENQESGVGAFANDEAEYGIKDTEEETEAASKARKERKQRRQSIGFSVAFPDGTVYHENQAVETFILALKKIGLERIASDFGVPEHAGYKVVDERERKSDKPKQRLEDGYYIYTNLGNDVKIDDLMDLSKRYDLGLIIKLDGENDEGETVVSEESKSPTIDWESTHYALPIKEQFWDFLHRTKAEGTANSYVSTLDNAVRKWVKQEVDERADSVFGYTTVGDVRLCIDMLNASPEYVAENDRKHHSMSAALNQYLQFVEDREVRFKE